MKAVIEIPKGDTRRRHLKDDKSGFVDLGPIKNVIPVNDGVCPVNYGYIPGTLNEKEGDEIDVLVFSKNILKVGEEVAVTPIALMKRADGDDKIVAVDQTMNQYESWKDIPEAERILIQEFFGHNSKIIVMEDSKAAEVYISDRRN